MSYRKLTENEIRILSQNNCRCDNWNKIEVTAGFTPEDIRNCRFRGDIRLGAHLYIDNVREEIANYILEDHVAIRNIESLKTTGVSSFGNGTQIAVLNESGGREVPIFDGLDAQTAYIAAMFRHHPEVAESLDRLIGRYTESISASMGRIGKGTVISNCGALTDIRTGTFAVLHGVSELTNGTVNSSQTSPAKIGRDVIARNFIISDSVEITDAALIENCFIGQGCKISKGFTATDSLFFANCDCQQGEACSVFAGPFTVTHHKSTLLIASMVSFFNAGSGSNQSNHMYRLGPIHQGVLERGCKSGSSSHILFPIRIGAFSVVNGRHYKHSDTSVFPFSRLLEKEGETHIIPGILLKNIGTARDAGKWEARDRRKGEKHDRINFGILTPYTISKIRNGVQILKTLDKTTVNEYNRAYISPKGIETGKHTYGWAVKYFTGNIFIKQLSEAVSIGKNLKLTAGKSYRQWSDLSGLIVPTEKLNQLLARLPEMKDVKEFSTALTRLEEQYDKWCWDYTASVLSDIFEKPFEDFTKEDYIKILRDWIGTVREQEKWLADDIAKEFDEKMRVSYAIDGNEPSSSEEFTAIHGIPENNPFLQTLCMENKVKVEETQKLIEIIKTETF